MLPPSGLVLSGFSAATHCRRIMVFPRTVRASSLGMGDWDKVGMLPTSRRQLLAAVEPFRLMRIFRPCCARGHWQRWRGTRYLRLTKLGTDVSLRSNAERRYVLNVASFD